MVPLRLFRTAFFTRPNSRIKPKCAAAARFNRQRGIAYGNGGHETINSRSRFASTAFRSSASCQGILLHDVASRPSFTRRL